MLRNVVTVLSFACCSIWVRAETASKPGGVDAFSAHGNTVCVLHENTIDLVDWSDIEHPKKLSSLKLSTHVDKTEQIDEEMVRISDVALMDNYVFAASQGEGISVVDVHNKREPKEIKNLPIGYRGRYNEQAMKIQEGMLYVCSQERANTAMILLDVTKPSDPKLLTDDSNDGPIPYVAYYDYEGYSQFSDLSFTFRGYYIAKNLYNDQVAANIYGNSRMREVTIPLDISGITKEKADDPITRAKDDTAIVTYGNRLWIIDLKEAKMLYKRDFDCRIELVAYNGRLILLNNRNSLVEDEYLFIDTKKPDTAKIWKHEFEDPPRRYDPVLLMLDSILLVGDEQRQNAEIYGYDISNIDSIKRFKLPFAPWSKAKRWILKSDNILFGCGEYEEVMPGTLYIADCSDPKQLRMRGMIKGVCGGPKSFQIQGKRLYFLDTGTNFAKDNWWAWPGVGVLKAIDISDLDKPLVKSQYVLYGN